MTEIHFANLIALQPGNNNVIREDLVNCRISKQNNQIELCRMKQIVQKRVSCELPSREVDVSLTLNFIFISCDHQHQENYLLYQQSSVTAEVSPHEIPV